jgi:hypothetical protein
MTKVQVTAKPDHIRSLAKAKPLDALAELIWNGFDSGADKVRVNFSLNDLGAIDLIRVADVGSGIDFNDVKMLFGGLGESWKKSQPKKYGRALHGKNGKGRFKAFGLGQFVEWSTIFESSGKKFKYQITGNAELLDGFEVTETPKELASKTQTGTEVVIQNLEHDFRLLKDSDGVAISLAKIFAPYLTEHPNLTLEYQGKKVDPLAVQLNKTDFVLDTIQISGERSISVNLTVIEWNIKTERTVHLCDGSGISLHELVPGSKVRAPGYDYTAYIKADEFRRLDNEGVLGLAEMDPDIGLILKDVYKKLNEHFREQTAKKQGQVVEEWKKEEIYPYLDKENLDPIETVERQVFDIIAVNVQSYLPAFEDSNHQSKKFTFKLLAQAIKDNPDSLQSIISEVLGLKKEAQDDLAELLQKTSLSSIISTAKIIANRLDFLDGLENLVFGKDTKKVLLERDQLHKILENEAWIFHEEFALAASEKRLEDVLNNYIHYLGDRSDQPVLLPDGNQGRIDLMLSKVIQPRSGEYDYLVVELKRPSKKIDSDVVTQIEKYAMAVASDERFASVPAKWTFIAVSNEMDDYAKKRANQKNRPNGLIYDDPDQKIGVWVRTWSEVINSARAKLHFINQHLQYEASQESAKSYLNKTHEKFIPKLM